MRFIASWTLYAVGDLISRPMQWFDWAWLYPAYNRLMLWSADIQGKTTKGPWKEIK